jgi:hypothetical protein
MREPYSRPFQMSNITKFTYGYVLSIIAALERPPSACLLDDERGIDSRETLEPVPASRSRRAS